MIDPITQFILEKEKNVSEISGELTMLPVVAITGALVGKQILAAVKKHFTVEGKKCKTQFPEDEAGYKKCIRTANLGAAKIKLNTMLHAMTRCNETRDPNKCRKTLNTMVKKQRLKLAKMGDYND